MQGFAGGVTGQRGQEDVVAGDRIAVETEIDGMIASLRAVVLRVHPETLWVALPRPDPRVSRIQAGQPMHLTFSRNGGAVVASSVFLHAVAAEPERIFAVERPMGAQAVQRRQYLRLDVNRTLRFRAINGAPTTGRVEATTVNISAGGVRIESGMVLCVGDRVAVSLVLDPRELVDLDGLVIRIEDPKAKHVEPRPTPGQPMYQIAIRFLDPPLAQQDRIVRHLFAVQRARREAERKAG